MARLDARAAELPRKKAALPAFKQSAGGVARHVGPVLVDDGDNAERYPDLLDPEPVRAHPSARLPHRRGPPTRPPGGARPPWPRAAPLKA